MSDDPTDDVDPFDGLADEVPDEDPFDDLGADREPPEQGGGDSDDRRVDDHPFPDRSAGQPNAEADDFDRTAEADDLDRDIEADDFDRDVEADDLERAVEADPLADLAGDVEGDPFESGDWAGSGTDDSVWEDLSTESEIETEAEDGRRISAVDKHRFCEGCRYFTEPPEIACTHEGTEILSFPDVDTVRVVDCPIVEERERLEQGGFEQ
ncbi:hypothetical protein [Halapricum desulfuricans]|uniref:DUF8135 domain-containing protein n=1 Tax=Halapricum desulfuricans TaxID=2841257 RepID=A0A897N2P5_9EURY|nr:hypothetical protein [Halapricum desulfuricans]QSG04586.1 Uncharacterized protein HSR121_0228 [Halapricum desulfuricans]